MARTHSKEFFHCNNCGEEVSLQAKVCPHCGADDETAWKDGINSYLVAEEDDFDYEEVVAREVHGRAPARSGSKWWVAVVAALLLALMLWQMLR
jgi:hypothetical protein